MTRFNKDTNRIVALVDMSNYYLNIRNTTAHAAEKRAVHCPFLDRFRYG